ncbi:hypothetical protein [Paenibacillus sp. TC-CSREp1]|uniref:hypothetical protein n=1 Tax=Paenibacillus sp. TC-CSREp1 TaxID=3410089 RepID=UPI003CFFF63B
MGIFKFIVLREGIRIQPDQGRSWTGNLWLTTIVIKRGTACWELHAAISLHDALTRTIYYYQSQYIY